MKQQKYNYTYSYKMLRQEPDAVKRYLNIHLAK